MKRLEIIANQSVRKELIEELESAVHDVEYTIVPIVHGKGKRKRKEGTRTWPETNFLIVLYLDESSLAEMEGIVAGIRGRFPAEGLFAARSDAQVI
jgi:hypothetical protein